MDWILNAFVVLFVVVDPVGNAPIFAALTRGLPDAERRRTAVKGVTLSAAILLAFFAVGNGLLSALGIGIPAFRIAGGLLLFMVAIDMVFARQSGLRGATPSEQAEAYERDDISIFPLAFPLIAGPGAITTVLLMASDSPDLAGQGIRLGVILVVLFITLASLLLTARIMKVLGETGANVIDRLLGLILAAIAVQFVVDGVRGAFGLG
ncbi:MarC family protein [Thiohalorhabdus sp.]|uniref:MarC family protein n=1 Tax=Thiohalorhabdus sp. TaxID=3094134 RepID=UPI002FC27A4E